MRRALRLLAAVALAGGAWAVSAATPAGRGAWLLRAAGCVACHTDDQGGGAPLAGGRALATPFGTFYSPNITPDPEHGIGRWTAEEFARALRLGEAPGGRHLYPVFPYPTYTRMRHADALALYAYLRTLTPVARPNREHRLPWYMRWRIVNRVWKALFLDPGPRTPDPARGESYRRGAYLVEALAHCGECHTPRKRFGALEHSRWLAGNPDGPGGDAVPNITPDAETGIGDWSRAEIVEYLSSGLMPDGDSAGGAMAEVIDQGLAHLGRPDLDDIATYLETLAPVRNTVARATDPGEGEGEDW